MGACSIYTRPAPAAGAQGARRLQQPQLLLCPSPAAAAKKLGFKETTARSSLCPALFETKMNFKAAPTPPALAGRGWNVGGRGVAIPAWILMFHPATHLEHIRAFSMEINSNRGFFMDFRAWRLKVSCVLFDFFSLIFQIFLFKRVFDHLYLRSKDFVFFLV